MTVFRRYAVYYAPPPGAFADRGDAWLGWSAEKAQALTPPDLGLPAAEITTAPRQYGFHGTIKPPFRLVGGQTAAALEAGLSDLAARLPPVTLPGLVLRNLDGFLALVPQGNEAALRNLAVRVVQDLDPFRAALTGAEIARRHPERLTPRQRALLDQYGYPFVMEEFRFHLTLTDRLSEPMASRAAAVLTAHFAPVLPAPFTLDALCLFGESAADGRFRLISRHALGG